MADMNEEVLRRSLDAIDRSRTRLFVGLAAGVVLLLAGLYHARGVVRAPTNIFVHEVFVLLVIWTTLLAIVVVIQITVMTKRILRAIELASNQR